MDLKDFVRESIVQIAGGISEANEALTNSNCVVNPGGAQVFSESGPKAYGQYSKSSPTSLRAVESLRFDVSVFASEGLDANGKIGLQVGVFRMGAGAQKDKSSGSESRIQFTIPIVFPAGDGSVLDM